MIRHYCLGIAFGLLVSTVTLGATADAVALPGDVRLNTTLHSLGIEWDLQGDTNHNAACTVRFRRKGDAGWREAMPLIRVDYAWRYGKQAADRPANMLAGSVMFLTPGMEYELQLALSDPDGGKASREMTFRTRSAPVMPTHGRTFHVTPGDGGGSGTVEDPFKGIASAEAAAKAGDVFLLRAGDYGQVILTRPGETGGNHIVWKSAGDGEARFKRIKLEGSFVWLHGLVVQRDPALKGAGIYTMKPLADVVLTGNQVTGFSYCINLNEHCRNWHISDNVIVGDKDFSPEQNVTFEQHLEGEGVELATSGGHVVCYNRISRVADGVSYPGANTDIYGNDIFDVTDDALEPDRGGANIRMWGNRLTNFGEHGISFQPMNAPPWYIVRNQFIAGWRPETKRIPRIFKFNVLDRFVCINNTFVFGRSISEYSDCLFLSICRNNLFISSTGVTPIWSAIRYPDSPPNVTVPLQRPGAFTDVDHNGYDWGDGEGNAFRYQGVVAPQGEFIRDLAAFSAITGVERNSLRVHKQELFEQWTIPAGAGRVEPCDLTLKSGSAAVDAGASLPNLCEDFVGSAPDLGAWESGGAALRVGPRNTTTDGVDSRWSLY